MLGTEAHKRTPGICNRHIEHLGDKRSVRLKLVATATHRRGIRNKEIERLVHIVRDGKRRKEPFQFGHQLHPDPEVPQRIHAVADDRPAAAVSNEIELVSCGVQLSEDIDEDLAVASDHERDAVGK